MAIDIDTARKVAKLARIRVEEADLPKLAGQLSGILGFMEELNEVDVTGVEPMTSVTGRQHPGAGAEERAGRAGRLLCGAEGGGMSANTWTIAAARDALRKGEISAVDLTMSCLTAIDAGDGLNAFVHKTPEIALEQARAADARIAGGEAPAMCGIPVGIKDLFCTMGVPSQAASNILKGFRPEYESTVTSKLFGAGAVMLGKLNMDEFAMGSSNETSCYGNVVNPWRRQGSNVQLTPGGSSGGSAAAVAADLCLAATGTDTGGSASSRPMGASAAGAWWRLPRRLIRRGR